MSYFVFDQTASEAIRNHINGINLKKKSEEYYLNSNIALFLKDELKDINPFCQQLNFIGNYIYDLEKDVRKTAYYNYMDTTFGDVLENAVAENTAAVMDYATSMNVNINDMFSSVYQYEGNGVAELRSKVEYFDVAHITNDRATGSKILTISEKGGTTGYVDINSDRYEPLSYPVIFQNGEKGYADYDSKKIPFNKYLASLLLKPELKSYNVDPITGGPDFLTAPHKSDHEHETFYDSINKMVFNDEVQRRLRVNRFQLCARLMQVYTVDMVSRQIDRKLNFIIRNQDAILMKSNKKSDNDNDNDDNSYDEGEVEYDNDSDDDECLDDNHGADQKPDQIFLPASLHGSPRHRKKLALNALSIVTERGKPTLFLTGTVNTNWPEIQSQLLKGQTAFDRSDVVNQVFRCRLTKFIDNLKAGKYFGGRRVDYMIYVIEYQWRGLPHFHMAVKLKDIDTDDKEKAFEFVDEFVRAELPSEENCPNMSAEKLEKYISMVKKHMHHDCGHTVGSGCKNTKEDFCKRGYDRSETVPETYIDNDGFIHYRRRTTNDFRIVPHNAETLIDWDGHLNVEFSGTVKQILYMFKYLYKGVKKQSINIEVDETPQNEISLYLKGRVLCSMDAMWRILGFHTYPKSNPTVKSIKVKLPEQTSYLKSKKLSCNLSTYFERPTQLRNLKYTEFFNNYCIYKQLPKRFNSNRFQCLNRNYFIVHSGRKRYYVCERKYKNSITRMEMCYINHGEIYYLRLILLKRPVLNYDDAFTGPDGKKYNTFQQSAISHGYIHNINDTIEQFKELLVISTPFELRRQFALMMSTGHPMWAVYSVAEYKEQLMDDFLRQGHNHSISENLLLKDLERLLQLEGKSLKEFGFEMPKGMETEVEIERVKYRCTEQKTILRELQEKYPNNDEQQLIFDEVMDVVKKFDQADQNNLTTDHEFILISAPGGSGKTTLCQQLQAAIRAEGIMIQVCAATTLAALLFEGAQTAHSLFKYPVVEECDVDMDKMPECKLFETQRLELLMETTVIFWDEFISNDRELFESVLRFFSKYRIQKKFIFVCSGDFRQILPVVRFGIKADIIKSCISSSPYYADFRVRFLKKNMRLQGLEKELPNDCTDEQRSHIEKQIQYAQFLMDLSCNKSGPSLNILEVIDEDTYKIGLPNMSYFTTEQEKDAISWLYPNKEFNPEIALSTVILSSTNVAVDKWNSIIQDMNKSETRIYEARDSFEEVDDENHILSSILTKEIMSSYNKNGVPTHDLKFKLNDVCIVLRAMKILGLATNTRVKIVKLGKYNVRVKTLNEPKERYVFIPRITFKFRLDYGESYQLTRVQIPLRLAYSMTYNKSQSQSYEKVLIDATGEPFAHGHGYTAFSRGRDCVKVKMFIKEEQLHPKGDSSHDMIPCITNIVYKDILI